MGMTSWLFIFAAARAISARADFSFTVVYGPGTPAGLYKEVTGEDRERWLPNYFRPAVHVRGIGDLQEISVLALSTLALVDVTLSPLESETLAGLAEAAEIPHIVLGYAYTELRHRWTFFVSGAQEDFATALEAVVAYFGWSRVSVISDANSQFSKTAYYLRSLSTRSYQSLDFPLKDEEGVQRTVGTEMRMSGNRISVFLTDPELSKSIVAAQYSKKIGGAGFGNIMPLLSSLYQIDTSIPSEVTGNLILAEDELASATTAAEYYAGMLHSAVSLFREYTDAEAVRKYLEKQFPGHTRKREFTLLNIVDSKRVVVGKVVDTEVKILGNISFLGNTTEVPQNAKSPLPISGNFGVRNVATISLTAHLYYYGAMLAVEQINTWPTLLENFNLELYNFTAGVSVWNYDFAYANISPNRHKLGYAVFSGTSSGVTVKLLGLLHDLNYSGPVVGSSNTVDSLASRKSFPSFVRTVLSDSFITAVYLQMFKRFGWTKCGMFVSNETWGLGFQSSFTELAHENGIEILNSPSLQVLPTPIPSLDLLRNYTTNFLDFINTKARILIIVVNNNAIFVVDYLYELGMRQGDIQVLANEWLAINLVLTNDTEVNRRRSEILRGAIQFSPVAFVGKFGQQVRSDYIAKYGVPPPVYASFFYDSALAVAYALDLVIRNGNDYSNPSVLLKALRGSRFVGSTGVVTFDADNNDRSPMQYNVLNAQFGSNDSFVTNISTVAIYDPSSTVLFRFLGDLLWCDGTTKVPSELRESTIGCPFEDKFNQEFPKGRYLLYGICALIALITVILTVVIWRLWWTRPVKQLTEKKEIQVQDVVVMAGIPFELLQYISMGPSLTYLTAAAISLMSSTTLDIEDFVTYKRGGYGLVWEAVAGTVAAWVVMCIVVFFHIDYRLEKCPGCRTFGDLSEMLIPLIGNLLFLPIVSILVDVFVCVKGVALTEEAVAFTDSYLHKDCYLTCWQGTHRVYVIGSSVALFVFLPAAVLLRPMWQEMQEVLNIHTSSLFLMVKTVVQVVLIVLNKTVKPDAAVAHGFTFLGIMVSFLAFSIRFPCFGYRRPAFWHIMSLVAVCWSTLLSLIYALSGSADYVLFTGLLVGGWGLIGVLGAIYTLVRIPSLLYRRPGVDTTSLFKFAFKRATTQILSDLRDNFKRVGHRSSVAVPPSDNERRYIAGTEDLSAERHVLTSPRIHQTIKEGSSSRRG